MKTFKMVLLAGILLMSGSCKEKPKQVQKEVVETMKYPHDVGRFIVMKDMKMSL